MKKLNYTQSNSHFLNEGIILRFLRRKLAAVFFSAITTIFCFASPSDVFAVNRFWDGGGGSNNWSDAANWSGDVAPVTGDDIIFSGASQTPNGNKDSVLDLNIALNTFVIGGYTGTITHTSLSLTVNNGFDQSNGTFIGGAGTIDFNSSFNIGGGSFTASSGTTFFASTFAQGGGTFNPNGGTAVFDGASASTNVPSSVTFANLTIDKNEGSVLGIGPNDGDIWNVTGNLMLVNGQITSIFGTIAAQGSVSLLTTFDGGDAILRISGTQSRTVTLPIDAKVPQLRLSAPNVTLEALGDIAFNQSVMVQDGTFNQNLADFTFNNAFTLAGGAYVPGSGATVFNSTFEQSGGNFPGGSSSIDFNNSFTLSGGTFTASSATIPVTGNFLQTGGTFNPNGGTILFDGNFTILNVPVTTTFNHLNVSKNDTAPLGIANPLTVTGTLTLTDGIVSGTINAQGNVAVAATFDGGNSFAFRFSGAANQTFMNAGAPFFGGTLTLDKTGGTVSLASNFELSDNSNPFLLTNGTITTGAFALIANTRPVTRTNGYIIGNLQRRFNSPFASIKFDVGTLNGYSPVTANGAGLGQNPSDLRIAAVQGVQPNVPSPAFALGRYWKIMEIGDVTVNLVFNYLDADIPAGVSESDFRLRRYSGSTFALIPSTIDAVNNTASTMSPQSEFSDWTLVSQLAPTAASATVGGRVTTANGQGISKARIYITDSSGNVKSAMTNPFGFYSFPGIPVGETYIVSVRHKSYQFAEPSQAIFVSEELDNINFAALKNEREVNESAGIKFDNAAVSDNQ